MSRHGTKLNLSGNSPGIHRREFISTSIALGVSSLIPDGVFAQRGGEPSGPDAPLDLIRAISEGDLGAVARMLDARPQLRMSRDNQGRSMFVLAHLHGQPKIAADILGRGLELDVAEAVLAQDEARLVQLAKADPTRLNVDHPVGGTAYYAAALFGRIDMIWPLNRWGASPNANPRGAQAVTPFRAALNCSDREAGVRVAYRILVDAGDPNAPQKDNDTVLHGAARLGDPDLVRAIIRRGGDVSMRNSTGETPLEVAVQANHRAAAEVLRNHERIPRTQASSRFAHDATGGRYSKPTGPAISQTVINHFGEVCHSNFAEAKSIHKKDPGVVHENASWNELGVEACAHMEQPTWTNYFLEQGAPLALPTALAVNDATSARRMLAEDRARIHERGPHDFALMWYPQIAGGHVDLAELLVEFGADINEQKMGTTCLHKAAFNGQRDLVVYLLERGAEINRVGESDFSPLHGTPLDWALARNQTQVAAILRDHGAKRHNG